MSQILNLPGETEESHDNLIQERKAARQKQIQDLLNMKQEW
jgi:hypothetical protein